MQDSISNKSTESKSMTSKKVMDDLQFRRRIYADPTSLDNDIIEAKNNDPSKKKLAQELCILDEKLKQAMQIPVPDDLCNKLLLRQTLRTHQQEKRKTKFHLALAASVAIIAGLVVNYIQHSNSYSDLGDYAIAHVYHEEGIFSNNDTTRVSLTSLNEKMSTFHGSFKNEMGELISADYCRFDGLKSLHLVFKGLTDTVTVFVVPKEEHLRFTSKFNDNKLYGESLSFAENNIIVVADKNESLSQWQQSINNNITWDI